jgi:hypothetical protein
MHKKITESTSMFGAALGSSPGRKLFKIPAGQYCGRLAAIVRSSPSEMKLAFADSPYNAWSDLQLVANDSADDRFDAAMDAEGNIHVVYTELTTLYLVTRKLSFSGGSWTVGPKVTIFNGNPCYTPSIAIETGGKLWVSWSRYIEPYRYIHVKSSVDSGSNWGSGPADAGQALGTATLSAFSKTLIGPNYIHVVYTYGSTGLAIKSLPIAGGSWSAEQFIATGTSGFGEEFDAAVGPDGLLAVIYNDTMLRYREFDGVSWGAIITLVNSVQTSPQLLFRNNIPVAIYADGFSGVQKLVKYVQRLPDGFSAPEILDSRAGLFETVLLYSQSSATCVEVTSAAQSGTTGDVFHPATGALLKNSGDALYLGMDRPFRYAEITLSTSGSGGTVTYSYWEGTHWQAFTPVNGASHLDSADVKLLLWTDYSSLPQDWQKKTVNGESRFWVKIEVLSTYSVGPVGSQISGVSEIQRIIFRR